MGLAFRIGSGLRLLLLAVALDQVFDGAFDDVAVTSFRVATAGEVNLVTVGDSVFYLLKGFECRSFGGLNLGPQPAAVFGDSIQACFDSELSRRAGNVRPVVAERGASSDVNVGPIARSVVSMPVDDLEVIQLFNG